MSSDPADTEGPAVNDRRPAAGPALLAQVLRRASNGEPPNSVELAEALWLAKHALQAAKPGSPTDPARTERTASGPAAREPAQPDGSPDAPSARSAPPSAPEERVPLMLPGRDREDGGPAGPGDGSGPVPHAAFLAPAPPMLAHPLTLQRTLRPLKRHVPAPVGQELDEEATARRIARLGAAPHAWVPVLRPMRERWLTLHLVHDTGPTMPVWRPLVRELHVALAQSGVFRTVELHRLTADGSVRRSGSPELPADERTIALLVSDCMGPQWRGGPAGERWYRALRRWASRMPVAVLQPVPERLWRTTALPATAARLASPHPAAPNSSYTVDSRVVRGPRSLAALPLPVLEPSARWLANWSRLVAGSQGPQPGSVALVGAVPPPAPLDVSGRGDVERLSAAELVLRFRSIASPEAFRLAGHLALGRPELPVMRLVQAAIDPNPQPQHLAEVILSGVLISRPGAPGTYAFRPGVRALLLGTLPRTSRDRTSHLLRRVGALIDERAGMAAGQFPVLAPGRGTERATGSEPFAAVRQESLRRLGGAPPARNDRVVLGRYQLVRRLGSGRGHTLWLAKDSRSDRTVTVQELAAGPVARQVFLSGAHALQSVDHPNVISVHDYGMDAGTPCLVTQFVAGLSVAELTDAGTFGLPFSLLAPLAQQIAAGLKAAHKQGVAHGRLAPNALLVLPDGTVKITHFALDRVVGRVKGDDLHRFGRLLKDLAGGDGEDQPGRIPAEFTSLFNEALEALTSADLQTQQRGQDVFLSPAFTDVLEAGAASRFRYQLLGPVRIRLRDTDRSVGAPLCQALLCMLLLRRAETVTFDELALGLWGAEVPEHSRRMLADCARGLRGALGPGVLATTADGHALLAGHGDVDIDRFGDLIAASKARRDEGDAAGARAAVHEALNLWHGRPLDGVPGPAAEAARDRLHAQHLTLCATRAELDLETGDFGRAANDLDELLRSHPRHLEFRRLHILALKGQGRVTAAIESYRAYDALRGPAEPDPLLLGLYEELRADPDRGSPVIAVEYTADFPEDPHTHSVLGRTLTWLLSLSDLAPNEYELLGRDNGYVVITVPDASVLTALNVVLRELPGALLELDDPPRLRVTFWHTALFARAGSPTVPRDWPGPDRLDADVVVVLSRPLYEELTRGGGAVSPDVFRPLYRQPAADGPAVAWYCTLDLPERLPELEPVRRDLVRGPFTTRDLTRLRGSEQGRTAVVHLDADTRPTLLDPGRPRGKRPPRSLVTYYEVDLTTHGSAHELALPSSGRGSFAASVELSWHVDDPVAFVGAEIHDVSGRLLDHLVKEAGRITRRHPLRRAGAAQRAVHEGLRRWPVPGLSVACAVRLRDGAPDGDAVERDGP
ncbi:SAV_2336 N-terminal domain-related protein [Streptomyces sp. NPDC001914]|uniref:SAV_2336 N-terminal domain-related protein n=1 Tax=Streptomyces sp. NPDC001914 TaxID=3364623 RepID=UPI0036CAD57F